MKIETLKELLDNKIKSLQTRMETARINGDIETILIFEAELEETTITLNQLNSLI